MSQQQMSERAMYLAMAEWLRAHGFSPRMDTYVGCGCFLRAAEGAANTWRDLSILRNIVGGFSEDDLRAFGWTGRRCTDDAVAACLIAADLAA